MFIPYIDHAGTSCYNIYFYGAQPKKKTNPVDARMWIRFWGEGAWIISGIISPYNTPRHPVAILPSYLEDHPS